MTPRPRHLNREFRTRTGTPAPGSTIAAIVDEHDPAPGQDGGQDGGHNGGPGDGRSDGGTGRRNGPGWAWDTRESVLLVLCGLFLVLGFLIDSPWIAVATLPITLLVPGHVVLRTIGRGFSADGDPWLVWGLRVVLSLAVWTVAGAVMAVTPGLDPRWLGGIVGAGLVLLTLVRWLGHEGHLRRVRGSAALTDPGTAPDGTWLETTGQQAAGPDRPEPARAWVRNRIQPVQAITLAVFAVVAAGAIFGAYLISSGGANPQPYIAISFAQPRYSVYDESGAVVATAVVTNSSDHALSASITAFVDGRRALVRQLDVPANGTTEVPLQGVRAARCWSSLRIAVTRVPKALRPLPLYAYGPKTITGGCGAAAATPRPSAT